MYSVIIASVAALASPVADAQIVEAPQQDAAIAAPHATDGLAILRAGTEIPLLVREELTTKKKKLRAGQRVQLEVASNVTANGMTIIPAGSPAVGEITEVRNKGMWGKSGYIGARVLSVRLGERQIRLSGTFDDKGVTGTGGVVAAVALLPIAGFLTTGTSAVIPIGSPVKGFLDEDISYRYAHASLPVVAANIAVPVAN